MTTSEQKNVERTLPPEATVEDLVDDLEEHCEGFFERIEDETGVIDGRITVTVDGTPVQQLKGTSTQLHDGATVRFAPAIVGG